MPAAVDIQLVVVRTEPVQVLVDTVELVVDTAMAADTVEDPEVDMLLALEQEPGQDMEWVLQQHLYTGLVLEECRKVVDSVKQEQVMQRVVASRSRVRQKLDQILVDTVMPACTLVVSPLEKE